MSHQDQWALLPRDRERLPSWSQRPEKLSAMPTSLGITFCLLLSLTGGSEHLMRTRRPPHDKPVIRVENGGPWGVWGRPEFCPEGTCATGFKLQVGRCVLGGAHGNQEWGKERGGTPGATVVCSWGGGEATSGGQWSEGSLSARSALLPGGSTLFPEAVTGGLWGARKMSQGGRGGRGLEGSSQ